MSHLVFVYGSLKAGFHNHGRLEAHGAEYLGDAYTAERYLLLNGGAFPYLINPHPMPEHFLLASRLGHVDGEVYDVDDACLESLDRLEGHPRFYRRHVIRVINSVNEVVPAWAYFLVDSADRMRGDLSSIIRPNKDGHVAWKPSDVWADAVAADREE